MKFVSALRVLGLFSIVLFGSAAAQLNVASEGRVVYGHHHIVVTDVDEHKRFWIDTLGGTEASLGNSVVVKFANVIVFIREGDTTGGTKGTTVNHIGFTVPDLRGVLDSFEDAGYAVVTKQEVPVTMPVANDIAYNETQDAYLAFVMAPDDIKIEFIGAPEQGELAKLHHIHFATQAIGEMQEWYANTLGAVAGMRGNFQAADLPGVNLTFSGSQDPLLPTKGRSFDHIGFEVDDLRAFCEELEQQGIVFDVPYRKLEAVDLSIAFFTDPFGTYIELTEGLDLL